MSAKPDKDKLLVVDKSFNEQYMRALDKIINPPVTVRSGLPTPAWRKLHEGVKLGGKVDEIASLINETNSILDDLPWKEGTPTSAFQGFRSRYYADDSPLADLERLEDDFDEVVDDIIESIESLEEEVDGEEV